MVHLWSGGVAYEVEGTVFDPTVGQIKRMGSGSDAGLYILVIASRLRPPPFRGFTIGCREMVAGKSESASVPQWRLWAPPPGMQRHYQGKLAMVNLWTGGVAYDVGRKGNSTIPSIRSSASVQALARRCASGVVARGSFVLQPMQCKVKDLETTRASERTWTPSSPASLALCILSCCLQRRHSPQHGGPL